MCGGGKYMYTEEYEHKGFPFKDFLIKLILVIIFVLLLVWLWRCLWLQESVAAHTNLYGAL